MNNLMCCTTLWMERQRSPLGSNVVFIQASLCNMLFKNKQYVKSRLFISILAKLCNLSQRLPRCSVNYTLFPNILGLSKTKTLMQLSTRPSQECLSCGWRGSCPFCLLPWRKGGQELPFILNSFHFSYLIKGHFLALQAVWLKQIFCGQAPRNLTYHNITMRPIW